MIYPSPAPEHGPADELRKVLEKTMGVPLFQEQAMKLAMVAAKFTAVEANGLRRAMATFRNVGTIQQFEAMMVERMVARGYDRGFAERCFEQIKGFGTYGFPESHAASFAQLVYVSSWIKCHHPAVFACALLNSQPMGFYAPAQIVRDAREHGVEVRAVDVNFSDWDNTLERAEDGALALRLGFRQIDGVHEDEGIASSTRGRSAYDSVEDLARRAALNGARCALLADADAFRSIAKRPPRRALGRAASAGRRTPAALCRRRRARTRQGTRSAAAVDVAWRTCRGRLSDAAALAESAIRWRCCGRFSRANGSSTCAEVSALTDGAFARGAGVVLVRQRPGKGNAIFVTLEDETGILNIVIWARLFERYRRETMASRLMLVEGRVQKSPENVVHLMAQRIIDRSADLNRLSDAHRPEIVLSRADEFMHPQHPRGGHPRNVRILPKSRDFH